ncbi:SusC/RagA family TonB-linked outer membrane protein [Pedobacter nyackensis]|uniref:SusC/RagA family TonB-linked outer membrane protein n=1 Tax=Pedobacter nyackensis TaxID=475255 RepID=UPI00292DDA05|nr:SusC/RagA family TonB-linked outer membrane protein [Pedobacter nyackensis]
MNRRLQLISLPLLLLAFFSLSAFGQISITKKNVPLPAVLLELKKQSGYDIVFNEDHIKNVGNVTVNLKNVGLKEALENILIPKNLVYSLKGNAVIIKPHSKDTSTGFPSIGQGKAVSIEGELIGDQGEKLAGVNISIVNSNVRTVSSSDGRFKLDLKDSNVQIGFSLLGYQPLTIQVETLFLIKIESVLKLSNGLIRRVSDQKFSISLLQSNTQLNEVKINTGMFERRKETFTGVTRSFTGKELRDASRINILEGLNMLDPSFKIIRDNNLGADPNQMPKIEIRGSRSIPSPTPEKYSQQLKLEYEQDPNQPLFILDGFETNLNTIVNLDVNRIESITLLKDAASTALYGSRSANGVVVVETIRPTAGDLRISYTGTVNMAMPDLSSYNMMSASELLKYQDLTSVGVGAPGPFGIDEEGDNLLLPVLKRAFRENSILNGVNSNWKKVPLQNSSTLNHALSVTGGDSFFTYTLGLTKGTNVGVMRGSENRSNSGYANLSYRNKKLNISNNLTINGQRQDGSPYGTFAQYVKIPPYYNINKTSRYLEEQHAEYFNARGELSVRDFNFANPLYNAHLPSLNTVNTFSLSNNLMANWDLFSFLRLSGGMQYSKSNSHSDYFVSPLNTMFDSQEEGQRGTYDYGLVNSQTYRYFFMSTYKKVFAEKHIVNLNIRTDLGLRNNENQSVSAVGFATTSEPLIYLANSYRPFSKPGGSTTKSNSMALIGSLNYSYDMRYNLDLSYNLSGTSNFGSDNPYQSFYALGVGWNIGRESFLADSKVVDYLNISANFGLTGNQNAGNFGSLTTYILNNDPTFFGEAYQLMGLGNPNLDWTKTYNLSYNLSGRFFKNRLSLTLSGYRNLTNPLIITMPLPLSVGLPNGVPKNVGKLTSTGLELLVDARVVNNGNWGVNIGINAPLFYKSKYSGLGDLLNKYNETARENKYVLRYIDGASPDDVWAVRSLGVGQARGLELFLDKDGNYTYLFNKNNEVRLGSSRPVSQGNVNVRVRYKKFNVSVYGRYIIQEMKFNTALYNKVENITPADMEYNQDKRALYVRWKNIGDDASFLGISSTPLGVSSRFLQKETALYIDGISFNYDLLNQYSEGLKGTIRRKLGLQAISFGVTTSNIFQFRLSNVKMERGLDYPFQRSVTLNMNLTF